MKKINQQKDDLINVLNTFKPLTIKMLSILNKLTLEELKELITFIGEIKNGK